MKKINFNQIPIYGDAPSRIINNDIKKFPKNIKEIIREYEIEKWGPLKKELKNLENPNIDSAENIYLPLDLDYPFFYKNAFYVSNHLDIQKLHLKVYSDTLTKYLGKSNYIVELGAGFGSKIIRLAQSHKFKNKNFYAGELTKSGREIIDLISSNSKIKLETFYLNLEDSNLSKNLEKIPRNSIIYSSYSIHYNPLLNLKLFDVLLKKNPIAIVLFEPCFELINNKTTHGIMCKKYIEINDYSKNIFSLSKEVSIRYKKSFKFTPNIIGENPFLPISIIEIS